MPGCAANKFWISVEAERWPGSAACSSTSGAGSRGRLARFPIRGRRRSRTSTSCLVLTRAASLVAVLLPRFPTPVSSDATIRCTATLGCRALSVVRCWHKVPVMSRVSSALEAPSLDPVSYLSVGEWIQYLLSACQMLKRSDGK